MSNRQPLRIDIPNAKPTPDKYAAAADIVIAEMNNIKTALVRLGKVIDEPRENAEGESPLEEWIDRMVVAAILRLHTPEEAIRENERRKPLFANASDLLDTLRFLVRRCKANRASLTSDIVAALRDADNVIAKAQGKKVGR